MKFTLVSFALQWVFVKWHLSFCFVDMYSVNAFPVQLFTNQPCGPIQIQKNEWFQNGCNKVVIELRVVQFWSEMILLISIELARFWNHAFDFRPNCTPLSSITIINSVSFGYHTEGTAVVKLTSELALCTFIRWLLLYCWWVWASSNLLWPPHLMLHWLLFFIVPCNQQGKPSSHLQ